MRRKDYYVVRKRKEPLDSIIKQRRILACFLPQIRAADRVCEKRIACENEPSCSVDQASLCMPGRCHCRKLQRTYADFIPALYWISEPDFNRRIIWNAGLRHHTPATRVVSVCVRVYNSGNIQVFSLRPICVNVHINSRIDDGSFASADQYVAQAAFSYAANLNNVFADLNEIIYTVPFHHAACQRTRIEACHVKVEDS